MAQHDLDSFYFENLGLFQYAPHFAMIYVAAHGPDIRNFLQSFDYGDVTYIPRMPYLVAIGKIFGIAVVPTSMRDAQYSSLLDDLITLKKFLY